MVLFLLSVIPASSSGRHHLLSANVYAEELDTKKIKQLEEQILSNPEDKKSLPYLDELSHFYLSQHQYGKFLDLLRKLEKKKVPVCDFPVAYYIGLCRYHQLRYLEETKDWKEYFDLGNSYRQELFLETEKIAELCPLSDFGVRAQLLHWLQRKTQNDGRAGDSLGALMDMVTTYAKLDTADIKVIAEVADSLFKEGELAFARSAYNLYINRLLATEKSPFRLQVAAEDALKAGNIDLAETIYDRYVEIIKDSLAKDNLANELIAIAKVFATDGWEKGKDHRYGEKVLGILQEFCGKSYFSEELQYLRAYNLQRLKEYAKSAEEYEILAADFPKNSYLDEVEFKLGILYTYILGQKEKGVSYWQKVIERNPEPVEGRNSSLGYTLESLYHKSLLSHYAQDLERAAIGYAKILELISENLEFNNLLGRVRDRQKEIQESKAIDYNLKTFLDAALERTVAIETSGLELLVSPYKAVGLAQEDVKFSLQQVQIETGCFAPVLTELWSGDLGSVWPVPTEGEFTTDYQTPGTKVVNLAVLGPTGVMGYVLEMVEVYDKK